MKKINFSIAWQIRIALTLAALGGISGAAGLIVYLGHKARLQETRFLEEKIGSVLVDI